MRVDARDAEAQEQPLEGFVFGHRSAAAAVLKWQAEHEGALKVGLSPSRPLGRRRRRHPRYVEERVADEELVGVRVVEPWRLARVGVARGVDHGERAARAGVARPRERVRVG
ncbi:MAG: hypothetical protein R3A52_18160 [Polyangiales bacterium]